MPEFTSPGCHLVSNTFFANDHKAKKYLCQIDQFDQITSQSVKIEPIRRYELFLNLQAYKILKVGPRLLIY